MDSLTLYQWLLLASTCLAGAMTPGLSLAIITRHTTAGGQRAGLVAAVSHAGGIGLWALAAVTGLAMLLDSHTLVEPVLSLAGAAFLIWLAARSWQQGDENPATAPQGHLRSAIRDGFVTAFINPKVGLFFMALFSQFLDAGMGAGARAQMVATATLIDGGWYALVAIMLGRSPLLPWLRAHQQAVHRATALLLLLVALGVISELLR